MDFDWDEANIGHIAKHGVKSEQIHEVFANDPVLFHFEYEEGEPRWYFVGHTHSAAVLIVVITERGTQQRVVTARKADKGMVQRYFEEKGETPW